MESVDDIKKKLAAGEYTLIVKEGKSDVWKSFKLVVDADGKSREYVQCNKCKALMSYDSKRTGTSTLNRHVANCKSTSDSGGASQKSIATYVTKSADSVPLRVKQAVTQKCVIFCARDIRPFYTVKGKGFKELAQELINVGAERGKVPVSSVLPAPNTISAHCKALAAKEREAFTANVKSHLKNGGTVGMTTDMWTDDFRKINYLAVTCHYIGDDYNLIGKNLATVMFPQNKKKTGENIRKEILKLLVTTFGFAPLSLKNIVWVTDEGSNIVKALEHYTRLSCMDHVLNTVLKHGLEDSAVSEHAPDIADTITAAKALVR